jgi:voltage-gated potassium channel Kch
MTWNTYLARRHTVLFYSLVLTMVAAPLFSSLGFGDKALDIFLAFNLLAAVAPLGRRTDTRVAFLALLGLALLLRVTTTWLEQHTFSAASLAVWTCVALFGAASALRFAIFAESVDSEHVAAALSAYLLAGVFFGVLYWALEQVWAGSFALTGEFTRVSAIYFSFVTLATLGYGDIVPRSDVARGLAIVEAIGGQLFLAVLVARLVSAHVSRKSKL